MKRAKAAAGDVLAANTCPICGRPTGAHRAGVAVGIVLVVLLSVLVASVVVWAIVQVWAAV